MKVGKVGAAWLMAACLGVSGALGCKKEGEKPQLPPLDVQVEKVEKKDVTLYSEWVGTTTGYVNAEIRPKVQGFLLKQNYTDGAVVKEGDVLFEIDPRQFQAAYDQAEGQLKRAQAALGKSELDVARYTPLAAQGAVSQQELDDAIQQRAADIAQVFSAQAELQQARLNLGWTKVTSPVTGIAGIAIAQIGDLVGETTVLANAAQLDPMKVSFPIGEIEYLRFAKPINENSQRGDRNDAPPVELILANGDKYPESGKISVAALEVSETTGTITIQALFPNPGFLLRPGQYALVRMPTDRRPGATVIRQRAVNELQGLTQVAVVGADDVVQWRTVKMGPRTGSDWVVESGIEPGETIVVEGLQKIRDGMKVAPTPWTPPSPEKAAAAQPPAGK